MIWQNKTRQWQNQAQTNQNSRKNQVFSSYCLFEFILYVYSGILRSIRIIIINWYNNNNSNHIFSNQKKRTKKRRPNQSVLGATASPWHDTKIWWALSKQTREIVLDIYIDNNCSKIFNTINVFVGNHYHLPSCRINHKSFLDNNKLIAVLIIKTSTCNLATNQHLAVKIIPQFGRSW